MPRRERTTDRHATLYAREDLPRPAARRRDAVAAELAALAESGALGAFDVVYWNKRVPEEGETVREQTLTDEFREWATAAGVQLAPCFDTRECYDDATGRKRTELVMPVLCLAVYEDEELVEVAPRGTGDEVVTVADCLERLGLGSDVTPNDDELLTTAG